MSKHFEILRTEREREWRSQPHMRQWLILVLFAPLWLLSWVRR